MNENRRRGLAIQAELFGEDYVKEAIQRQESGAFGSILARHADEACYGEIWARDGLDRKSRSIATLAILVALGTPQLAIHVRIAVQKNGVTVAELEELLLHSVAYLGYPRASVATRMVAAELKSLGLIEQ